MRRSCPLGAVGSLGKKVIIILAMISYYWPAVCDSTGPSSVRVGSMVDKVALGLVFLRVLRVSPVSIFLPVLVTQHRRMYAHFALFTDRHVSKRRTVWSTDSGIQSNTNCIKFGRFQVFTDEMFVLWTVVQRRLASNRRFATSYLSYLPGLQCSCMS
jgi:hypothetical protein